ncbi:Uncharacterised protein [Mycobacteroides abscessus subsp. bolletii]|uniref:hypothetical protein n=1 Tax=Mycobacteroides abscessus TaxID=36809 RepID=UPI0009C5E60E|nr:hypothetical protein [Mycobacteroides abscessus]SLI56747.1 Uncharacterised protein [Mycobacteroides abscessus subsp. bolletii]
MSDGKFTQMIKKYRSVLLAAAGVIGVVAAVLVSYTLGMNRSENSQFEEFDKQVSDVIEQYVDAMNKGDASKIQALSIGPAEDELVPGFNAGGRGVYSDNIMWRIKERGQIHIATLEILSRGDTVYSVHVYTKYADQKDGGGYYPAAEVLYSLFRWHNEWKVMSINQFMDYNQIPKE